MVPLRSELLIWDCLAVIVSLTIQFVSLFDHRETPASEMGVEKYKDMWLVNLNSSLLSFPVVLLQGQSKSQGPSNPFQFATEWSVRERGSPVTTKEN